MSKSIKIKFGINFIYNLKIKLDAQKTARI